MENLSKMHELPFIHRVARQKWEFLQDQGYYYVDSDEKGITFTYGDYPDMGFIDWWGKVTWYE